MFRILLKAKRAIKRLLKVQAESRQVVSGGSRPRFWRVLVVLIFASGVTLLAPALDPSVPINLPRSGDIANGTIVTSHDLTIRKTAGELHDDQERMRVEIPPILDFDSLSFQSVREKLAIVAQTLHRISVHPALRDSLASELSQTSGIQLDFVQLLARSSQLVEHHLQQFSGIMDDLLSNPGLLSADFAIPASNLRTVVVRHGSREEVISRDRVLTMDLAKERLVDQVKRVSDFEPDVQGLLIQMGAQLLKPTLSMNTREHDLRIQYEIDRIDSIAEHVAAGSVLVRAGEVVSERQARLLNFYLSRVEDERVPGWWQSFWMNWLARWLLVAMTGIGLIAFLRRFRREIYRSLPKLVAIFFFLGVAVVGAIAASQFASLAGIAVLTILPVAVLPILLAMLVDTEVALLATVCLAIQFGLLERFSYAATLHTLLVGTISAFLAANIRRRSDAFRVVILVALVTVLSLLVIRIVTSADLRNIVSTIEQAATVSIVSSLFAIFILIPVAESLFGFTTDIRLLELTDLNHPLLKRLSLEAPGTYHHSLQVSNLSEAAAKAVGANVLLTRAGALFHDVGKMEIPEYFVENQHGLKSRHEQLSPTMSALILSSHVKRGRKLGEEADLPDDVLNFIEEHHGTMVMSYFYRKAQEQVAAGEKADISEDAFRYPGPRPQSRETAIVMLADAVEASSRTLDDPKPARIESLIQRIIADRFSSGELDACPLTLRDMARIRRAFVQVVVAAFHQRIEYPKGTQPE